MTKICIPEIARDSATTTQDYAYARLRNAIMVGAVRPGTALTFRGLAEALDLSPTPIREAVRRLSSEKAITVLENRRLMVPDMSEGRFEELVQLRIVLETYAAERALPYLSEIDIEAMRKLDDAMDGALAMRDLDTLTRINQEFHKYLYCLNPFQTVMPLIESVWLQLGPFQRQVIEDIETVPLVDHHKEMLAAMGARDVEALCTAIERDVQDGSIRFGVRVLRGLMTQS
jgi:DNA-binding GntR family transcriptional regulator